MFLDPIKIKFRQIGFRLWAGFCFFFILCLSAVFFIAYSLLQNYLIQRDHELIESKLQEYAALYSKNGLAGLKKIDTYFHADAETPVFLIRLENQNHRTIFLHTPLNPSRYEAKEVDLALQTAPRNTKWIILDGK